MANRRVIFFGDSHVAGVGDPSGLGRGARVVAASFASGTPLTAYNSANVSRPSRNARCRGPMSPHQANPYGAHTSTLLFPLSTTYALPVDPIARPSGSLNSLLPVPALPNWVMYAPLEESSSIRLLPVSAT
jgi:hypothetical protein